MCIHNKYRDYFIDNWSEVNSVLSYVILSYVQSPLLSHCVDVFEFFPCFLLKICPSAVKHAYATFKRFLRAVRYAKTVFATSLSLSLSLPLFLSLSVCLFLSLALLANADQVKFFQREQFWIKRWKTSTPHGLNKRQEIVTGYSRNPNLGDFLAKAKIN